MALNAGTKLGPYEILSPLGAGGMGEVYRARDTKLGRDVAVKVLPERFTADPERLARFEREAKLLASLNHSNIAGIHDLHEVDGVRFLVMELVEGTTLAERIDDGPIPIDVALALFAQIAEALEAAHQKGIVHRDLKPANIKITEEEKVKVLDFGLAKAMSGDSMSGTEAERAHSPTLTLRSPTTPPIDATREGAVLGTAPYMSPEQARGRSLDKRTDIWAFGCCLFEALTGRRCILGETTTDLFAEIIKGEPEWDVLPPETPPTIRLLLRRCLTKDRKRRLQDIGDARVEILAAIDDPESGLLLSGAKVRAASRGALVLAIVICVPLLVALGAAIGWIARPVPLRPLHLALPLPPEVVGVVDLAISPDGQTVAIVAELGEGEDRRLYVRDLSAAAARELPGTRRARRLRFSPSGDRIFYAQADRDLPSSTVRSVPVSGGPTVEAFRSEQIGLLSARVWTPYTDEELLVASQDGMKLYRVPSSGGTPQLVTEFDWPKGHRTVDLDVPRPGGDYVLVTTWGLDAETRRNAASLYRVDLASGAQTRLAERAGWARLAGTDRLAYTHDTETLYVAPFDADRGEFTGAGRPLLSGYDHGAISANGVIIYTPDRGGVGTSSIEIVTKTGERTTLIEKRGFLFSPRVSPDGGRVAFVYAEDRADSPAVWVVDVTSGLARPVTPKSEQAGGADWHPDGRLAYSQEFQSRNAEMVTIVPGSSAEPEALLVGSNGSGAAYFPVFGPDGRHVVFAGWPYDGREPGLYLYELGSTQAPRAFFASPVIEGGASFSPDGKWVAYHTSGTGEFEVYIRRFIPEDPESAPIYPVSTEGGLSANWASDGTLYFLVGPDRSKLYAVTVETEPEVAISEPRLVHEDFSNEYDVFPDGERFVVASSGDAGSTNRPEVRIILNWMSEDGNVK